MPEADDGSSTEDLASGPSAPAGSSSATPRSDLPRPTDPPRGQRTAATAGRPSSSRATPAPGPIESRALRWSTRRSFPYLVWSAITATLVVLQHVSARVLRDDGYSLTQWRGIRYYIDGWSQFDGPEYIKIAESGYFYTPGVRSPIVWFPLYPMLLRAMNRLVAEPILAGMIVASIGGLVAAGLYWRWLAERGMSGSTRLVAFLFLLTYPYGWYLYGVVHSDAVFLALVLGAFLLVEHDKPVLAGLVGALATATRPTGLAVIPALVVLSLERSGVLAVPPTAKGWVDRFTVPVKVQMEQLRLRALGPLLACLGVGSYMVYLGVSFGDPLAFRTNQTVYHPGGMPLLKFEFFHNVLRFDENPTFALTIIGQAFVTAVVLCSVPFVGRRFGWGYGVFAAALVSIPTFSTEDFMGTGRYMLAAFPVAALLGEWLSRQAYRWIWLGTSGAVMAALSMGFARSWYLT